MQGIIGTFGFSSTRFTQFGATQFRSLDSPILSEQLVLMGGGLLLIAAILLTMQRRRDSFENSPFHHEILSYLSRIANALEHHQSAATHQTAAELLRRFAHPKFQNNLREFPKSRTK